jgi:hypothetical protein
MKNVTIAGLTLRFDWGTLELMAEVTGKDSSNPLEGITNTTLQANYILYGALARVDERADRPVTHSVDNVRKMLKDFSGSDIKELLTAYVNSLRVNSAEPEDAQTDEEKKSGKEE